MQCIIDYSYCVVIFAVKNWHRRPRCRSWCWVLWSWSCSCSWDFGHVCIAGAGYSLEALCVSAGLSTFKLNQRSRHSERDCQGACKLAVVTGLYCSSISRCVSRSIARWIIRLLLAVRITNSSASEIMLQSEGALQRLTNDLLSLIRRWCGYGFHDIYETMTTWRRYPCSACRLHRTRCRKA